MYDDGPEPGGMADAAKGCALGLAVIILGVLVVLAAIAAVRS